MMAPGNYSAFSLGNRLVLPGRGTIECRDRDGVSSSHLEPRVMRLLLALHDRPDQVVARPELVHEVWGDKPVSDDTLNRCVSELRHALNDDPRHPTFIKTVPGEGYCLLRQPEVSLTDRQLDEPGDRSASASENDEAEEARPHGAAPLLAELRRRKVIRAAMAYTILAWGLVQTMDVIWPHIALPEWPLTMMIMLAILGFPIVLVLAWAFEVTPKGVVLDMPLRESYVASAELSRRSIDFVIIGALLIVVCIQAYLLLRDDVATSSPVAKTFADQPAAGVSAASVAVLPFTTAGTPPQDSDMGDGVAGELVALLSDISGLSVVSRTSSFAFRDARMPVRDIGSRLGVATVLEGSVRQESGIVHVNAQLVDVESQFPLWSQNFVRPLPELFYIQYEIAEAVTRALDQRAGILRRPESMNIPSISTGSLSAYTAFLQASSLLPRRDRDLVLESIELFSEAISLDNQFARAHAGLAAATLIAGFYGWLPPESAMPEAAASANTAVALNPDLAEPHAVLAALQSQAGNFREAEEMFRLAVRQDQKSVISQHWFAAFLLEHGRLSEALTHAQLAHSIDPVSPTVNGILAVIHMYRGDLAQALQFWEKASHFGLNTENYLIGVELALQGAQPGLALRRWMAYLESRGLDAEPSGLEALVNAPTAGASSLSPGQIARLDPSSILLARILAGDYADAVAEMNNLVSKSRTSFGSVWGPLYSDFRRHEAFEHWLRGSGYLDYWLDSRMPDLCRFAEQSLHCR